MWEEHLGEDLAALAPFLDTTDEEVACYPCPIPQSEGCPRGLYRHGDGRIEAYCRSTSNTTCPSVWLKKPDLAVLALDLRRLLARVASLLGLPGDGTAPVEGLTRTFLLGAERSGGGERAIYLTLQGAPARLAEAVERLLARDARGVLLLTGAAGLPVAAAEFLRAKGGRTLRLDELTVLDDDGALVAAPPARAMLALRDSDGASAVHDGGPDPAEPPYCRLATNAGLTSLSRAQYDALVNDAEGRFAFFLDGVAGTAMRKDLRGRVHRAALRPREFAILREFIEARRPVRPRATRAGSMCGSDLAAFKLFTDARAKLDVRLGAKRYRAFRLHQVPAEPAQNAYEFAPPPDLAFGMVTPP